MSIIFGHRGQTHLGFFEPKNLNFIKTADKKKNKTVAIGIILVNKVMYAKCLYSAITAAYKVNIDADVNMHYNDCSITIQEQFQH